MFCLWIFSTSWKKRSYFFNFIFLTSSRKVWNTNTWVIHDIISKFNEMYRSWINCSPVFNVNMYLWRLGMGFLYHKHCIFFFCSLFFTVWNMSKIFFKQNPTVCQNMLDKREAVWVSKLEILKNNIRPNQNGNFIYLFEKH